MHCCMIDHRAHVAVRQDVQVVCFFFNLLSVSNRVPWEEHKTAIAEAVRTRSFSLSSMHAPMWRNMNKLQMAAAAATQYRMVK